MPDEDKDQIFSHTQASYKNYKFRKIKDISVTVECKKNDNPSSDTGDCEHWKITKKEGLFFFEHAKEVLPSVSAVHDYDVFNRFAEGIIELPNGDRGVWEISPGGTGSLTVNPGKPNERFIRLYCKTCDDQDMGSIASSTKDAAK